MNGFWSGDSIMIHSGKYTAYIGNFIKQKEDGKVVVRVDLSPEPIIRTLILLSSNISHYSE